MNPATYSRSVRDFKQDSAQTDWINRLCPACGLCCNGVLFADVHLLKEDNALVLEKSGLKLEWEGRKTAFGQPCSCFDGQLCSIYHDRPACCRNFDCHTLKQARAAEITDFTALGRIRAARQKADEIKTLLHSLGNCDEHLPLTKRYQAVMNQPIDLSNSEDQAELRGELMLAVDELMKRFHRDFLDSQ